MSKSWRVILIVLTLLLLLGAICVGVGLFTGGEWSRVYSVLDTRYHVDAYVKWGEEVVETIVTALKTPVA